MFERFSTPARRLGQTILSEESPERRVLRALARPVWDEILPLLEAIEHRLTTIEHQLGIAAEASGEAAVEASGEAPGDVAERAREQERKQDPEQEREEGQEGEPPAGDAAPEP